jgi:uncharacterized protein YbgA (DUF1722 family)
MLKLIVESAIRHRLVDIYKKLAIATKGMADLSEQVTKLVEHVMENRKTLNVLIDLQGQVLAAVAEEERQSLRSGIPSLKDLLSSPIDDDDMPN